jgi:hypothetical protein
MLLRGRGYCIHVWLRLPCDSDTQTEKGLPARRWMIFIALPFKILRLYM